MSKLESIASIPEAKRTLQKISFDFSGAHVAYTDNSAGGAASGLNDPILLKSQNESNLSDEQRELISLIGEEPTPLDKSKEADTLSKQQEQSPIMGEQVSQEDFLALKKELALEKSLRAIEGLGFDEEVSQKLAETLCNLDSEGLSIVKSALSVLKDKEAVVPEETELQKSLSEEEGHEGEGEPESFLEQIKKAKEDKEAK